MSTNVRYINRLSGEAIDHTSENLARDYMRSLEGDMKLGSLFAKMNNGVPGVPGNAACYAHGLGGAPSLNGVTRRIDNLAGVIHQRLTAGNTEPDGATPGWLSYWVAANELQTTLTAGNGSHPRIDLIELKLDVQDESTTTDFEDAATGVVTSTSGVTSKRIRLTKNVVIGTPSATPVDPSGTAGYVPWAKVWVPTSFNAAFTTHVADVRFPLGYQRIMVPAGAGIPDGGVWATNGSLQAYRTSGAASEAVVFVCPAVTGVERILGITAHTNGNSVDLDIAQGYLTGISTSYMAQFTDVNNVQAPRFAAEGAGAASPMAWWTSGYGYTQPVSPASLNIPAVFVRVISRGSGTHLYGVSFDIAGGV